MGKKLFLVWILCIWLVLSACTFNKKIDNSFDITYQNLFQEASLQNILDISTNYQYTETTDTLQINWDNDEIGASIDIDIQSKNDKSNLSSDSNIDFDIEIEDKKQNQKFLIDWILETIFTNGDIFINIQTWNLNMGTGNVQWDFINTMLGGIQNMWIQANQEKIEYFQSSLINNQTLKQIKDILLSLKDQQIFQNKGQTEYNWYNAYKIDLNKPKIQEIVLDIIKNNTGLVISTGEFLETEQMLSGFLSSIDFEWVLVVKSENQTDLIIEKLDMFEEDQLITTIVWNIGQENISLYIKDLVSNISAKITIDSEKRWFNFEIEVLQNEKETLKIEAGIKFNKLDKEWIIFKIDWFIQINLWDYYQTEELEPLEFNFVYNSESYVTDEMDITTPENSILLYQLLWDQFGMDPTVLEDWEIIE